MLTLGDGALFWPLAFDPNGSGQLEDYQRQFAPTYSIKELLALAAHELAGVAWQPAAAASSAR